MRDLIVTLLVFASLPYIFKRPSFGIVMWIWISVMNPHSQGWGFARSFPFAAIIAGVTLLAMLFNKEKFRLPNSPVTWTFILFILWMCFTTLFAFHPEPSQVQLVKVLKITGMTLALMMLARERQHISWIIWTVVVSIGYYGVKGGIFAIRSGGAYRVWGPSGTFIDGNNEIALALVMTVPLMVYLVSEIHNKWGKRAMWASAGLCSIAALASYSRGAALALGAMLGFLWLKSSKKAIGGMVLIVAAPLALLFMPEQWHARIDTINTYEQDGSAMGRINAWKMALNLAADRPIVGGGFEIYEFDIFRMYAPVPEDLHAAHSIYFQILGEHGWVGFLIYALLGVLTWRTGTWVIRNAREPQYEWAVNMVKMIQVSLLGFMVGGAFLSLAYFDVPYYLMIAMVAIRKLVEREKAEAESARKLAARRAMQDAELATSGEGKAGYGTA